MAFIFSKSKFEEEVEKATSELAPVNAEDLGLLLDIADMIKSKSVTPKEALRVIRKRLSHKTPSVQLLAIHLLDICVKNGGQQMVAEVASEDFMDFYWDLSTSVQTSAKVGQAMFDCIHAWANATKNMSEMRTIYNNYIRMKSTGYWKVPEDKGDATGIMLESTAAPDWTDSAVCERCRADFTLTNRKHHCRACGRTFCQDCSSRSMPLPNYGIKEDVRVCDGCHARKGVPPKLSSSAMGNSSRENMSPASSTASKEDSSKQAKKEDEDLALAIRLSLEEQKPKDRGKAPLASSESSGKLGRVLSASQKEEDDLQKAIAASLALGSTSSAAHVSPPRRSDSRTHHQSRKQVERSSPRSPLKLTDTEVENIELFSKLVEALERDPVASMKLPENLELMDLYHQIGSLQPKLVAALEDSVGRWQSLNSLQEKVSEAIKKYDTTLERKLHALKTDRVESGGAAIAHSRIPDLVGSVTRNRSPNVVAYSAEAGQAYAHPQFSAPPVQQQLNYSLQHVTNQSSPTHPRVSEDPRYISSAWGPPGEMPREVINPAAQGTHPDISRVQYNPYAATPINSGDAFAPSADYTNPLQPSSVAPATTPYLENGASAQDPAPTQQPQDVPPLIEL